MAIHFYSNFDIDVRDDCKNLGGKDFGECLLEGGVLSELTVYRHQ